MTAPENQPSISRALVRVHRRAAAVLSMHHAPGRGHSIVSYLADYHGPPISSTMPVRAETYEYDGFPPFFEGLLPEGIQLEGLLRQAKIDKTDYFGQLVTVGGDLVGAVTIERYDEE